MKKYELLYIIDKDATEEKRDASIKKINDMIAEGNGVVASMDKWGMKKFAYPINFKNEGFYVLVTFEANAPVLKEIEERMKVSETFVRFMITSVVENRKTEAAKTAKKPERRERTEYRNDYKSDYKAPRVDSVEEVVKTVEEVVKTVEDVIEKDVAQEVQA